jgi:hypothetical protein
MLLAAPCETGLVMHAGLSGRSWQALQICALEIDAWGTPKNRQNNITAMAPCRRIKCLMEGAMRNINDTLSHHFAAHAAAVADQQAEPTRTSSQQAKSSCPRVATRSPWR